PRSLDVDRHPRIAHDAPINRYPAGQNRIDRLRSREDAELRHRAIQVDTGTSLRPVALFPAIASCLFHASVTCSILVSRFTTVSVATVTGRLNRRGPAEPGLTTTLPCGSC